MEELSVCASNYNMLPNLFCNVKNIWSMLFFPLPVWLLISLSSSLQVSKTIFALHLKVLPMPELTSDNFGQATDV